SPGTEAADAADAAVPADPAGAFPAALTDRYHPLNPVGSGSEGTVWHVRRADGGGDAAVKVGNPGVRADAELLAHLAGDPAFRRHVPEILGHGQVEHAGALCDWMAMEYLPVTLADHVAELRDRRRLDRPGESERIIRELVDLLAFWQTTIARNPVDFKPANILVRPAGKGGRSAAQFVVADFGGVAKLTASRRFSPDMQVTVAYMAPEQLAGHNHPAGPWWALGTILHEVFTGAGRYRRADGGLISDEALQIRLVMDAEVDVTAIADERRRLLLQGLFTKDPADRWTAEQVRAWLAGGSPEVVRSRLDPPAPEPAPTGPAHRPIGFRGQDFHDPAALAEAMLGRSADAAAWLVSGGARRLRDWLRDEVKDTAVDLHYLKDAERGTPAEKSAAASRAVLALGAAFTPGSVPYVRDRRVDAAGLAQLAGEPDGPAFVDELVAAGMPALAARFDCGHAACPERSCARLLGLTRLAEVLTAVEREARALGGRGGGGGDGRLTANERRTARRWALLLTVQPEQQRRAVVGRLSVLPGP
ncbi:protein kinase domain-containing protein, partial [Kitasatospora putterlickiae]|uniref:protein kinase domain-containing protein n=1 Tax=Kitasatospora putterlickiae TaxID=221725 RepID=UPI0031D16B69